jgi:hypothetical protein
MLWIFNIQMLFNISCCCHQVWSSVGCVRMCGTFCCYSTDAVRIIKFQIQSTHLATVYRTSSRLNSFPNIATRTKAAAPILFAVVSLKQNKGKSLLNESVLKTYLCGGRTAACVIGTRSKLRLPEALIYLKLVFTLAYQTQFSWWTVQAIGLRGTYHFH